jgi:hypothetical protein
MPRRPGLFLDTDGDVDSLPKLLGVASCVTDGVAMSALADRSRTEPLLV